MMSADSLLQQAFDFTDAELDLNRTGRTSARQAERIKSVSRVSNVGLTCGLLGILLAFGAITLLCSFFFNLRVIIESQLPWIVIAGATLVVIAFAIAYANWRGARERALSLTEYSVVWAQGTITFKVKRDGDDESYYVKINYRELPVSWEAFNLLQSRHNATQYRIYYDEATQIVLSAEVITG